MTFIFNLATQVSRYSQAFGSRWQNLYYNFLGVKLKGYIWMRQTEIPRNFGDVEIEAAVALDRGVTLLCSGESTPRPKIHIGSNTYINRNTFIDAALVITIGEDCAIGPGCYITDHDHSIESGLPPLAQPLISQPTRIGDRVWLGANVTVLKGVTIGDDAVIGAGSVVTKDIPEGAIAVGVPARVVRFKQVACVK
jgi:acetyltransferase-like isoleucine patch superfamily enzyme